MATATTPESDLLGPQPATEPEGLYEVVDGQVREKPPMGNFENFLASDLLTLLNSFVKANRLGWAVMEPLFRLDPEANLQRRPDLAFISAERWPLERGRPRDTPMDVMPDLAVEVISPSNSSNEVMRKVEEYFHAGVQQVWVVCPSVEKIHVYHGPNEVQILDRARYSRRRTGGARLSWRLNELFGEA